MILQTIGLVRRFGSFRALDDLSLSVAAGARHAIIGPNGAGKTTLTNLLAGSLRPTSGRMLLDGQDITHLAAHRRARRGLVRTFQVSQLFPELTLLQSVLLALFERERVAATWWRPARRYTHLSDEAIDLLGHLRLGADAARRTRDLPYGKQRLLEIALGLARRPRVLMLDEPLAGVPMEDRHEIMAGMERLPEAMTIVLIEHDMDLVFRFAQRISVLANGRLLAEGTPAEIAADRRVREVYLGGDPPLPAGQALRPTG